MTTTSTKIELPEYHMVRLGTLTEEFQNEASHFVHEMTKGVGIRTLNMAHILDKMANLYKQVVCYLDVARSLNGGTGITIDDGLDALEIVRQIEMESTTSAEN